MTGSSVKITKQAAARQLIQSAVRMCSDSSDAMAAHLIAASALGIIRDLIAKRGHTYQSRALSEGFFAAAKARLKGEPDIFPQNPEFDKIVDNIAVKIRDGSIKRAGDVLVQMPQHFERTLTAHIFGPAGFLKHADRRPDEVIDLADVRPIEATMHAITAYALLFPAQRISPEVERFVHMHVDNFTD